MVRGNDARVKVLNQPCAEVSNEVVRPNDLKCIKCHESTFNHSFEWDSRCAFTLELGKGVSRPPHVFSHGRWPHAIASVHESVTLGNK